MLSRADKLQLDTGPVAFKISEQRNDVKVYITDSPPDTNSCVFLTQYAVCVWLHWQSNVDYVT